LGCFNNKKNNKVYILIANVRRYGNSKGTPTQPGINGLFRNRSVEENLAFEGMKMVIIQKVVICFIGKTDMESKKHANA
jgi:glutaminyl-tRNA synthetase